MRIAVKFDEPPADIKANFKDPQPTLKVALKDQPEKFRPKLKDNGAEFKAPFDEPDPKFDAGFSESVISPGIEPPYGNTVQIGDVIYQTLGAALSAVQSGETIVLLNDIKYDAVIHFETALCLDLNGHTLKAKGLAVLAHGGSVVDTGELKGLLEVPKGSLVMNHAVYGMLPVWNEEETGYFFAKVIDQKKPVEIISADSFAVEFRPSITGNGITTKDVFCDGALDNEITFKPAVVCYNESGSIVQTIALQPLDEELISKVYTNSTSFRHTVSGVSRYARCALELTIETEAGLVYCSEMGRV